jgi:carboxyl-terminal processing protease
MIRQPLKRLARSVAFALALTLSTGTFAAGLDGVWRSRGYGTIINVHGQRATLYDINTVICQKRSETALDKTVFRDPRLSADGKSLTTTSAWAFTTIYYDRLQGLPALCTSPPSHRADDPLYNLDVFWSWFNEYYAFSARRAVDWETIRAEYRPQLAAKGTTAALRAALESILRQLQDYHITLSGAGFRVNSGSAPLFNAWLAEYGHGSDESLRIDDFVKGKAKEYLRPSWKHYLDESSIREVSPNVVIGRASGGRVGYLLVTGESGYSHGTDLLAEQAAAARELEPAFDALRTSSALILDIRINFGGDDGIALMLAGLLTDHDRAGLAKCTRYGSGFTPTQQTEIHHNAHAFTGPVVILSSPYNVSAGENFVMMAKDFPNVLIVGDRSAGVHSDTLDKELPNGWTISVSNEAFVAPDGSMYETVGVPPDVLVPYYPEEVRSTGVDPLMEKALHVLHTPDVKRAFAGAKRAARGRPSLCS